MNIWNWKQNKGKTTELEARVFMLPKLRALTSVTHLPTPLTDDSESPTIQETKSENLALNCGWHRGRTKSSSAETGMMEPLPHPKWHLSGRFRKARVTAPRDRQVDSLELIRHRSDQQWRLLTRWSFVGRACEDLSQTQTSPVQMLRLTSLELPKAQTE